ncbi:uncharacterized protein N7484_007802 [Penicillium longicatenatum]|uniref:uncharacterized protein n=1 Tax=Penicillium longicatenatum TaxID=1561947 RepID=UPI0025486AE1|nr:uncharacterized protein N7484_007802 [Penicillium longicatenatum]KAJ5639940.1 hypothetical protein N7484_007802 [Penicillium longicatenatum]
MYQGDTVSFLGRGKDGKPRAQVSTPYWVMFNAHYALGRFIISKVGMQINLCPSDAIFALSASTSDPYQTWLDFISWEVYGTFVFWRWSIELSSELLAEKAM